MSTKEVFDYVMNTPKNTNPAVLSSMLGHLSWNDLKDKPFYEEVKKKTIVDNKTYGVEDDNGSKFIDLTRDFVPKAGITYIIVIDGVECGGLVAEENDDDCIVLGSLETLLFFLEYDLFGEFGTKCWLNDSTATHTLSIYEVETIVHKIDEKYLPDSAIGEKVYYILHTYNENEGAVLTATEGIYEAIQKNIFDDPTGIIVKIIEYGDSDGNSYHVFDVKEYERDIDRNEIMVHPINGGRWAVYYILRENGEITFYDGG